MVSPLNDNKIDFRISFDESDDEDYTKGFPAIVYNDALISKLDFLTEPTVSPQHIDEFNLKDETSLSECDGKEQNVLYFNDLFPFNVVYPDDSKSDKDNDDDKLDIGHSSGHLSVKPLLDVINTDVGAYAHGSNKLLETIKLVLLENFNEDYSKCLRLPVEVIVVKVRVTAAKHNLVLTAGVKLVLLMKIEENILRIQDILKWDTTRGILLLGSTSGIRAILQPGEYDLWNMRMKQYIQCIDYTQWEIVENGNAPIVTKTIDGKETVIPPTSVDEKAQKGQNLEPTKYIPQLDSEDLQQIHPDDLEEMDLRWNMDFFGLTFVKSLMKKMYCLVVTNDFSWFSLVFFLATKDETSEILKTFITGIENLIDLRVKVIRTPQQNGVAERKNRTLIEAARTMLADSKLPTTFWAEAVNTACRKHALSFMRPFGCPVTILNTIDHLDALTKSMNYKPVVADNQFNGSADIKACDKVDKARVETVPGKDYILLPLWTQDLSFSSSSKDSLDVGFKPSGEEEKKDAEDLGNEDSEVPSTEEPRVNQEKDANVNNTNNINTVSPTDNAAGIEDNVVDENIVYGCADDPNMPKLEDIVHSDDDEDVGAEADINKLNASIPVNPILTTRIHKDHPVEQIIRDLNSTPQTRRMTKNLEELGLFSSVQQRTNHKDFQNYLFACFLSQEEPKEVVQALKDPSWIEAMQEELLQFKLQEVWTLVELPNGKRAIGTKWVFRNKKDDRGIVIKNKARLVAQEYTQEEGIDYDEVFSPVTRIEAIRLFLAYASFKDFLVYQMDVKSAFLYGKIEEEVYVCYPPGFEDPNFPNKVYKVEKALYGLHQAPRAWDKRGILLVQVYVDDIIFGSTKKSLCTEFEKMMHKKFQMSSIGELTFFLGLQFTDIKKASTPMETHKPLLKDENGEDVDEHMYRSMIGLLMYLTSSRLYIMFAVYACAKYQVNPKVSHLHAVKRIFRYLKGQPKLGLWYPKDSPFDLVACTDSNYAGASLDRKSTTGGCQFLGKDVWNVLENQLRMEFELVLLASSSAQFWATATAITINGELQIQALVDRKKVIITKSTVRRDLCLEDAEGIDCLPNAAIFEELTRMGAKTSAWNEFSSTMASAIICLATNQKFNFSKYVFESMMKNLDSVNKFLMYPRNMKREGKGFSGKVTPLFPTMMVQAQEEIGEGSELPTDPYHIPIITPPSTSQPQKKQKSRKPKRQDTKKMVKRLEKKKRSRTHRLKRLYKVGLSARVESFDDEGLGEGDASKQGRIDSIDEDDNITLDSTHFGADADMFGVQDLKGDEVIVDATTTTVGDTTTTTEVEVTLAQALVEIKTSKPKAKRVVFKEPSESTTTTTLIVSSPQPSKIKVWDKGKAIMMEEPLKMKKKYQISFDEQESRRLQAEFDEEEIIAREKDEANIALTEEWNDI
ncbi:putative ribonuclease H-like domain-containing protein [Tanacetum coccineum]